MSAELPVFIHCLFRSGSTYLFNAFRRSPSGYYCYEEPFSEHLINPDSKLFYDLEFTNSLTRHQRHPELDRPYKFEFAPLRSELPRVFDRSFPYELAFLQPDEEQPALERYVQFLLDRAPERALLQFCRSAFRSRWLHRRFAAVSIYLLRNAHDQFMSHSISPFFLAANLRFLSARTRPPLISTIAEKVGVQRFGDGTLEEEIDFYVAQAEKLSMPDHYRAFLPLWLLAAIENVAWCDQVIDIDQLSTSSSYGVQVLDHLASLGVTGLDFSDCRIQQRPFGERAEQLFKPIEEETIRLFEGSGYDRQFIAELPLGLREAP
ncbi:MAG: hypothetical protein M1118_00655 [Chloroflexi bacterium]|nr:hypothetical protein [Chloroflexota bacterium]